MCTQLKHEGTTFNVDVDVDIDIDIDVDVDECD